MDPNETLRRLREKVREARADAEVQGYVNLGDAVAVLEYFAALDEWLSKGGFLPEAWRPVTRRGHERPEPLGPPNPADGHLPEHHEEEANG